MDRLSQIEVILSELDLDSITLSPDFLSLTLQQISSILS